MKERDSVKILSCTPVGQPTARGTGHVTRSLFYPESKSLFLALHSRLLTLYALGCVNHTETNYFRLLLTKEQRFACFLFYFKSSQACSISDSSGDPLLTVVFPGCSLGLPHQARTGSDQPIIAAARAQSRVRQTQVQVRLTGILV